MLLSVSTNPPKTIEELFDYIKRIDKTEVDYIHCDIMDGHFVTAKTFNHKTVLKKSTCLFSYHKQPPVREIFHVQLSQLCPTLVTP